MSIKDPYKARRKESSPEDTSRENITTPDNQRSQDVPKTRKIRIDRTSKEP